MKEIKKENKNSIILFIVILTIATIIFLPFLKMHYATDTYKIINIGLEEYSRQNSFTDGRAIMGIFNYILAWLKIPASIYVPMFTFLAIVTSTIVAVMLNNILLKYKPNASKLQKVIAGIISYVIVFNFFYLECFYFIECFVIALSILFYLLAAKIMTEYNKFYVLKGLILVTLGVICYQGTVGMFVIFVLLFSILKHNNKISKIAIDLLGSCGILLIGIAIDFILVKTSENIFGTVQGRLTGVEQIINNIAYILEHMWYLLQETSEFLPANVFLSFLIVVSIIAIITIFKTKEKKEVKLIQYTSIAIAGIGSAFIPSLMSLTAFYTGRMRVCIGAIIGILFFYLFAKTELFEGKKILKWFATIVLVLYTGLNVFTYGKLIYLHKQVNIEEKEDSLAIGQYIAEYEQENEIEVKKVAIIFRGGYRYGYLQTGDVANFMTINATKCVWSITGCINFYNNLKLEEIQITREEEDMFLEYESQYLCIDDVLYIRAYVN